jgi:hypothetical protein
LSPPFNPSLNGRVNHFLDFIIDKVIGVVIHMTGLTSVRLLAFIHAAELALYLRWQSLGGGSGHKAERAAMEVAAEDLLAIKIRKLGWPAPCL